MNRSGLLFLRSGIFAPTRSSIAVIPKHQVRWNQSSPSTTTPEEDESTTQRRIAQSSRGYEKEFFEKFYYLGHGKDGKVQLAKTMEDIYQEQKDQMISSKIEHSGAGLDATAKSDETVFTIEGQNYNPLTYIQLEGLQEKYLPEGFPGRIDEYEFQWISKKETMCRESYGSIMENLKQQQKNGFLSSKGAQPLFIDGLNGTGKSVALCHIVLFARAEGWLTLYVPEAYKLVSRYRIKPSQTRKWIYDLHEGAVVLLENFKKAHHDKLATIKMRTSLPKIEELQAFNQSQTKNTTLLDLIEFGITCDNPSEVFLAVRNELDAVTEYPVLIAVDDINCLYGNTGFMKPIHLRSEKIAWAFGDEISVLRALNRPHKSALVNGTCVSSLTSRKPIKHFLSEIGEETFKEMRVEIPPYSYMEYYGRVMRYLDSGDLLNAPSVITEKYIYQVCCGRPKHVASYFATLI